MVDDPRYATNARRNANRPALVAALQETFLTKTYEEWESVLLPAGIPMGAINMLDQVVEHPQVKARGALVENTHPVAGTIRMTGPPVRMSDTPGAVRTPAPLLGEHTEEVLKNRLGLTDAEVARLQDTGVIGKKSK
jgi:crotonobetainyl-CoA:carnitine CoA-transferase CaiB-like acyl-CoA transferase